MRFADSISEEELRREYIDNADGTVQSAARTLGCSATTFLRALALRNLQPKLKTRSWHRSTRFPVLNDRDWLAHELETKTMNQIAAELGTTNGNVADHAYRLGLRERGQDRAESVKKALLLRYPGGRSGADASNWKGGRCRTGNGHIYCYAPDHQFANDGGYVMEHRLMMEQNLGRLLTPDEVVHHKNGKKDDNRIENLEVMSRSEHVQLHFDAVERVHQLEEFIKSNGLVPPESHE